MEERGNEFVLRKTQNRRRWLKKISQGQKASSYNSRPETKGRRKGRGLRFPEG